MAPELKTMPPEPKWLRVAMERIFVDAVPAQHKGLQQILQSFPADVIVGDDMFFGVLPMLLGPRSKRPPIVLCGTSILYWRREDGAPMFAGLPPATARAQRDEYAAAYRDHDRLIYQPVADRLNRSLEKMGVGPLTMTLFDSVVPLADVYMQLSVPSCEFPRDIPRSVQFVGAPPIIPNQAPLPPWAHELDGSRKIVLVTQGPVANHNFGLLVAPTPQALREAVRTALDTSDYRSRARLMADESEAMETRVEIPHIIAQIARSAKHEPRQVAVAADRSRRAIRRAAAAPST